MSVVIAGIVYRGLDVLKRAMIYDMANLQVNLPETLYQRLRKYARKHHRIISDIALEALEREMARHEWQDRHSKRPATDLGDSAASLLEQERRQRDEELA